MPTTPSPISPPPPPSFSAGSQGASDTLPSGDSEVRIRTAARTPFTASLHDARYEATASANSAALLPTGACIRSARNASERAWAYVDAALTDRRTFRQAKQVRRHLARIEVGALRDAETRGRIAASVVASVLAPIAERGDRRLLTIGRLMVGPEGILLDVTDRARLHVTPCVRIVLHEADSVTARRTSLASLLAQHAVSLAGHGDLANADYWPVTRAVQEALLEWDTLARESRAA